MTDVFIAPPPGAGNVWRWVTQDGKELRLRPISSGDLDKVSVFLDSLSSSSRYFRFGSLDIHFSEVQLLRVCNPDPDICRSFVVVTDERDTEIQVASGSIEIQPDRVSGELAFLVADRWRGNRIADPLMQILKSIAKDYGLDNVFVHVLATNKPMLHFAERHGFVLDAATQHTAIKRLFYPFA